MSKRKLHAIGDAGRSPPKNSSFPFQRVAGSVFHRWAMLALCVSYALTTSFIVAGIGGGAHSAFPFSRASMIIFSSQTICQAISCAVRDFGSGRYSDFSGIRERTFRVVLDSVVQKFVKSDFSSIAIPYKMVPSDCVSRRMIILG